MTKVACDGFEFDFTDALEAFVFDEKAKSSPHYHGLSHAMKAVDIVVELPSRYLFVEVKDFHEPDSYHDDEHLAHLLKSLQYKYRDSWLYRWCEGKTDKPITYLCLLELENALLTQFGKELRRQIPVKTAGPRWCNNISDACIALNFVLWNARFPAWPVIRLP
jgi:hypothetical protein